MTEVLVKARPDGEAFARSAIAQLARRLSGFAEFDIDPEHGVAWRVKTAEAIRTKARLVGPHSPPSPPEVINDFIGVRVLAGHCGCLGRLLDEVAVWAVEVGLEEVKIEDRFGQPDESGYRAYHIDFRLRDSALWNLPPEAGVELQLSTWLQHFHSSLSHWLYYKPTRPADEEVREFLVGLSSKLGEVDKKVADFLRSRGRSS